MIRALQATTDAQAVTNLFQRTADYVTLESGQLPDTAQTHDFFTGAPSGSDPATALHLGLFLQHNQLVAIAEVGFGFPNPDDAYIGLLLIDPAHRGKRLGQDMLAHILAAAKARQVTRILIAVLEENTRGRRFWSKMGFTEDARSPPKQFGLKTHVQIRMAQRL